MARRWSVGVVVVLLACGPGSASGGAGDDGGITLGTGVVPLALGDGDAGGGQAIAGQVAVMGASSAAGVTLTLSPGAETTTTDSMGSFLFESVPTGTFAVTAALAGYVSETQTVVVTAGNDRILSFTLERSQLLLPLAVPSAGAFMGYARWIGSPDGGESPGTVLFFGANGSAWQLTDGGTAMRVNADGGLALLGFDATGGAVVELSEGGGEPIAAFLDSDATGEVAFASDTVPIVDGSLLLCSRGPDWFADAPDYLAPTSIATEIAPNPVIGFGGLVGWSRGSCLRPLLFGPALSVPLGVGCSTSETTLTVSADGDRMAFVSITDSGPWQTVIVGDQTITIADGVIDGLIADGGSFSVYPMTALGYVVPFIDGNGAKHLITDGWDGTNDLPIAGWAPMHGTSLLIARPAPQSDLTVIGAPIDVPGPGVSIPFDYPWTPPLFSPSDRYAIFPGAPALFDLVLGIEVRFVITPVTAAFDRSEAHVLLSDASGDLAIVSLTGLAASTSPQGTMLEGTSVARSFTADEGSVAYLGQDPEGNTGFFVEPLPASL